MLDPGARFEAAAAYFDTLSDQGLPPLPPHVSAVVRGVQDSIYGPVVASNLEHVRQQDTDPQLAAKAIGALTVLTRASSENYARNAGWMDSTDFKDSLGQVQREMTVGGIALLPDEYAMTRREGRAQVRLADNILAVSSPKVERVLSDGNYTLYFSNRTMSSGAELPERIEDVVEEEITSQEKMPHLTRTNLAIGQVVQGIAEHHRGRLSIVDTGSGTGATLAAITAGLGQADGDRLDNVGIHGIEPNADFWKILQSFSGPALEKLLAANTGFRLETSTSPESIGTPQTFGLIHGEVSEIFSQMPPLPNGKDDITVITANYVWHRLTSDVKAGLIDQIAQKASNGIFLIADLVENGSRLNRQYFNFGNNGPLNSGNIGLVDLFESRGFVVADLTRDVPPASIHPKLVEGIREEARNDGRLWVAYKGEESARVLAA